MRSRILFPLAALLVVLLMGASPVQASVPDPARQPAAAGGSTAQPDAAAAEHPPWYLTTVQWLTWDPKWWMDTSCISGRHRLGAGHYDWHLVLPGGQPLLRWSNMYLGAGDYTMEVCLDPLDTPGPYGEYDQTATLTPDNPNWKPNDISWRPLVGGDGTYTWGASLQPRF